MAYPFFSGEIQHSSENDGELDSYEIYHRLLLAYPGYTIERIETELSWRQVKRLFSYWEKEPPAAIGIMRISNMLEAKFGLKSISASKPLSGDDLVNHLRGQGLL